MLLGNTAKTALKEAATAARGKAGRNHLIMAEEEAIDPAKKIHEVIEWLHPDNPRAYDRLASIAKMLTGLERIDAEEAAKILRQNQQRDRKQEWQSKMARANKNLKLARSSGV